MSKFYFTGADYQNDCSKREVSKENFLDELTYQKCEHDEYLCANGDDEINDGIMKYYEDLKEEILSNQFPDKEYNLKI